MRFLFTGVVKSRGYIYAIFVRKLTARLLTCVPIFGAMLVKNHLLAIGPTVRKDSPVPMSFKDIEELTLVRSHSASYLFFFFNTRSIILLDVPGQVGLLLVVFFRRKTLHMLTVFEEVHEVRSLDKARTDTFSFEGTECN